MPTLMVSPSAVKSSPVPTLPDIRQTGIEADAEARERFVGKHLGETAHQLGCGSNCAGPTVLTPDRNEEGHHLVAYHLIDDSPVRREHFDRDMVEAVQQSGEGRGLYLLTEGSRITYAGEHDGHVDFDAAVGQAAVALVAERLVPASVAGDLS